MSEMSYHRLQSHRLQAKGNESPNEAASFELRASSECLSKDKLKMLLDVIKNWLHAARFTLHARWSKQLQLMRDFKKLLIWQMGMDIVKQVYKIVKYLPDEERFGLRYQMTKSSVSIPSNIAEGSAKRSQKDYHRFVEIALGSAYELETQSLVVESQGWVPRELMDELLDLVRREQQMVTRFMDKL